MSNKFDINDLRKAIDSLSDEKYKKFHEGLCKTSKYKINGVRMPELRKIAKDIIKNGFADDIKRINPENYEEAMLKALVIAGERKPLSDKLVDIESFIPEIDNWAICDTFSSALKPKKQELDLLLEFVKKHIYSDYEYEIRLAVVLSLNCLITDNYIDCIIEMLSKVDCSYYYTSMAIAWALCDCFIKFRDKTYSFLKKDTLDKDTLKRTVQKIVDSYRASKSDKELIRALR